MLSFLEGNAFKLNYEWIKENDEELIDILTDEMDFWGNLSHQPTAETLKVIVEFEEEFINYYAISKDKEGWEQKLERKFKNKDWTLQDNISDVDEELIKSYYNVFENLINGDIQGFVKVKHWKDGI